MNKQLPFLRLLAFLLICLAAAVRGEAQCSTYLGSAPPASAQSSSGTNYNAIAIDASGTPYVAYQDIANGNKATVKKYNSSSWVTVGAVGFSAGTALNMSLAIDAGGTPYVAYRDVANGEKSTVMKYNGTSWVTVGAAGFSASNTDYISLAIDAGGTPYVTYLDGSSMGKATVMKYNGSSWVTVGAAGFSASYSSYNSIAVDAGGTPYLVYEDNSSGAGGPTVMKYNGSSWVTVGTASFSASVAFWTSIAIDAGGTPYVAYQDIANGLKATVKKFDGSSWVTVGTVGFSAGQAKYTSIAIDAGGTPYITYQDGGNGNKATVMKYNGTSWVTVGVAGFSVGVITYPSLAIDAGGTLYITYQDQANGSKAAVMKYNGSSWVGTTGFSASPAAYTSIAIDTGNNTYVAYEDESNSNKSTVMKFDGSNWITVGTPGFSASTASYTSLVTDAGGNLYLAYQDGANSNKVTVMKYNGSSWVTVGAVGFSAGTATYISLAIDVAGTLYVTYEDGANSNKATVMKYNGSSWVTVGSAGFSASVATYTSLAIDAGGNPYVAFQSGANSSKATVMKYNGSSWVAVGTAGFSAGTATYTSIAVDGSGTPYIVYQDAGNSNKATVMKYNGSSWVAVGTAGFSAGAATCTSIAIDGSGNPSISYADGANGSKATVMRFTGTAWVTVSTASVLAAAATTTAIAIMPSGDICMAYTDGGAWVQRLKFPTVSAAQTFCGTATVANLSTQATGTINWYTAATGGTALSSSTALTTGYYYASYTDAGTGCESARSSSSVSVNTLPATPTASNQTFCGSVAKVGNLAATITAGNTLKWYNIAAGGTALPDTTTLITGTTYYATQTAATGCESARKAVVVTVNPSTVIPPVVTAPVIYYQQGVTVAPLSATGTTLKWYTQALGGTGSSTTPTASSANAGDKSYWVTQTVSGCESARSQIDVVTISPSQNYLNFDGINDEVVGNNTRLPMGATPRTMEAWIKTTGATHLMAVMNYGNYTHNQRFGLLINPAGYLYFVGETNDYVATTGKVNDGLCHHVAVTYDSTTVMLYVDGALVGSTAKTLATAGNQFSFGTSWRAQWDEFFKGDIDEVRIWNTARTQQQLQDYMTADLAGNEPGLVAYHKFSSGTGGGTNTGVVTAVDGTTYGNNATLSNFALAGSTSNWEAGTTAAPVGNDVTYCLNQQAAPLTGTGSNLKWYTAPVGGTGSGTGPVPVTNAAGSAYFYVSQATGCHESARDTVVATTAPITDPPLATVNKVQTLSVTAATTFSNGCSDLISTITPAGAAPLSSSTTAKVFLQSTAPSNNGSPYVRRYYDITPATGANTATANITLYFTQADFDDYNAHRGAYPSLPVDAADAANNKANLNVSQQHGTSATGNPGSYTGWAGSGPANVLITPTTVAWNSTATRWEVTFPVTGFSGFFISTGISTPLAVTLTGISATNEGSHNRIDWTTKTEQEGDYFEVERSLDANSYQTIGTVTGKQVQGGSYTLVDEAPATGVNYYRIKMMSATGTAQYSKTVSATVAQGSFVLEAYPNPATDRLTIRISGITGTNATISILDASGKTVSKTPITGTETVLPLEGFSPGLYLLEYRDNNQIQHIKVQKQ